MDSTLARVAAAVHYVVARTEPSRLGFTKLNKVLWYSDIEHYRRHGTSLTGLTHYIRMSQGPMSKAISAAVRELESAGKIAERPVKVIDYTRRELIWLVDPDISIFTAEQIDIVNQVMDVLCKYTAVEVSDSTHDVFWKELSDGDVMPIGAGSIVPKDPTQKQIEWAKAQIE